MQGKRINLDVWFGLCLMAFSAYFFAESRKFPAGSAQWPAFVLGGFFLLAMILFVQGVIKTTKNISEKGVSKSAVAKAHIAFAIIAAYVILIAVIGFYPATAVFCPAIMLYYGLRKIKILLLVTVIQALFIYLIFEVQLKIPLPSGIIFGR